MCKITTKIRGLGRGLDALLSDLKEESAAFIEISVDELSPNPFQPRKEFDEVSLAELAESIKLHGLLQPLIVRKVQEGYQIIAGERRWKACKMACLSTISASVRDLSDIEMMSVALVENIQRENLNVIEEAFSYKQLMENCDITQDELAKQLGKSRSSVANTLRLLNLPDKVQSYLAQSLISTGHAKVLLSVISKEMLVKIADRIIAKDLSVRETEELIREITKPRSRLSGKVKKDVDVVALENELQRVFGSKVSITGNADKGKVVIEYYSAENLDKILEMLRNG